MDHGDCILRHLVDLQDHLAAGNESEALAEADAICWRALALSQELHEACGSPLAPGAKAPRDCREYDAMRERDGERVVS